MESRLDGCRGSLLGLAVGDAMGYGVEGWSLAEIRGGYGPLGLRSYELFNGFACTTSHTQIAAYASNALLLGATLGRMQGRMSPYTGYVAAALREWGKNQRRTGEADPHVCWVSYTPAMDTPRCMDVGMLDRLNRREIGSVYQRLNHSREPGGLMTAVPVGLFFDPGLAGRRDIQELGADVVALTHGSPLAFLTGAALSHMLSRILWDSVTDLHGLVVETRAMLKACFGREFRQVREINQLLQKAILPQSGRTDAEAMERLGCRTAPEVLAGAIFACIRHRRNFSEAIAAAVNHSGASAATGAVAGAILGAMLGAEAIEPALLEPLECRDMLLELSEDLFRGCPMGQETPLFDVEWEGKYINVGN